MLSAAQPTYSAIFMIHGDLRITWDETNHDAVVAFIQNKMDEGVSFFKIDPESKAKKPPVVQIETAEEAASNRQVYVRDPDIKNLIEAGFANIASFSGVDELKTVGRAKTAEEAATTDTVAVQPKQAG